MNMKNYTIAQQAGDNGDDDLDNGNMNLILRKPKTALIILFFLHKCLKKKIVKT